tara:strand:+ start:2271 stop:4367 length:2097 start_codon:yes stop_codon:yes gene_type:complete
MEGNLFNSGFLGSKFLWWIGQVADDRTWRENQNPKKVEDPKEETPAWGYRYKVRIMGCHDQDESSVASENLPWAQVMYSVWGGGLGGSRQTPGIKQGMFVFGFFLDGQDQQVPVIMGILGSNSKTVVKDLKTGISGGKNFVPQSGWANADKDESKIVPDEQIATTEPSEEVGTCEATDAIHQETVQDKKMKDVLERKHALSCPDPLHQSDTKNLQTQVEELSKKIEARQRQEEEYASAVSSGLPTVAMNNDVQKMIDDSAGEMSGPMKGIMNMALQKTVDEHNLKMLPLFILAIPAFKNVLLTTNIAALEDIACTFNDINKGLAGMIAGALASSFARKSKQPQTRAVQAANAKKGKGTSGDTGGGDTDPIPYQPTLPDDVSQGIQLPSPAPEGYYQPSPICSTEELLGEVLGSSINKITQSFGKANDSMVAAANDGTNPDTDSVAGSAGTKSIDMSISERNVTASLEKGALVSGMAAALASAIGVDKNVIGRVTRAFQQGQYGYGLEVMSTIANAVGTDVGRQRMLSNIMDQISSGDIAGGFSESASLFGIPVNLMAAMGAGFAAIKSNDMGALTGALQNLGGLDPAIMGSVAGMADSGGLVGGLSSMGGISVDIAESMNFVQSITQLFDCDPEFECSPNDEHTLGEGGSGAKDEPNCAAIAEAADNAKEKPPEPEYEEVPIYNARGRKTGTRKVLKG